MIDNFIDEVALLKAFIDNKTLSYNELQERGFVPVLTKQEQRALFKHTIDKFRKWKVIDHVPDSNPKAWVVIEARAQDEYDKLIMEIERKQIVEKYSFEALQEELRINTKKLKRIRLYNTLALTGFLIAVFHFITGMGLPDVFNALKHVAHIILNHGH